MHPIYI